MKIFSTQQIAVIDQFTIEHEPITDLDLMERASLQMTNWVVQNISNEKKLMFFAGPGNNGGDALAVARLLADLDYQCEVFILDFGKGLKGAPAQNLIRLKEQRKVLIQMIASEDDLPVIEKEHVVLDGLFGSGLNRKLEGLPANIVQGINASGSKVVAIDIPSGLKGEDNSTNDRSRIVKAEHTLTLQFPKLSFFFPEHEALLGKVEVLPIGLHPKAIEETETSYCLLERELLTQKLIRRSKFSHKGTFGHALLIAGSYGKIGASVLAANACLRSGVGLLTAHLPHSGYPIMQTALPEAMCSIDPSDLMFTEFPSLDQFSAIGIGPALGLKPNSRRALKQLLEAKPGKIVLDADALNILSMHPEWLKLLPVGAILTPHPKEFERLVGESSNSYTRLQKQRDFAREYQVYVVLKGAHTSIATPDGKVYFNNTGNPGMATAGSGDVLTGIILGLLAQAYEPLDAALLGVWIHGVAGDLAAERSGYHALIASDVIQSLGKAFLSLRK
ncbi:NAD(P)H-hydrate dehydratase [Sunxiuqinia elliptica]